MVKITLIWSVARKWQKTALEGHKSVDKQRPQFCFLYAGNNKDCCWNLERQRGVWTKSKPPHFRRENGKGFDLCLITGTLSTEKSHFQVNFFLSSITASNLSEWSQCDDTGNVLSCLFNVFILSMWLCFLGTWFNCWWQAAVDLLLCAAMYHTGALI